MIDNYLPFGRLMRAGIDGWKLSMQITETMIASQAVIGTRMAMLGSGLEGSTKMPFAEFGRLVPEKTAAFAKAQAGATRALGVKSPAGPSLWGTSIYDGLAMLDVWERSLSVANAWWLPLHATSTANAKRLSRSRR